MHNTLVYYDCQVMELGPVLCDIKKKCADGRKQSRGRSYCCELKSNHVIMVL